MCGLLFLFSTTAWAWGKRGHQIVGEAAAIVVSDEPESAFMRNHAFDIGYYANVPDFMWKKPATYAYEKPQHFMDMEIYDREFAKHPEITHPLALGRKEFEAKFPEIKPEAGRSFFRIREFYQTLEETARQLRELKEPAGEARQKLQLKWLITAGTMTHYLGDLSMPLHVSENYDGQLTGQKGIHGYYEEVVVDQIYPRISCEVNEDVHKEWPDFKRRNKDKTELELLEQLTKFSRGEIAEMLAADKKSKREELEKNSHLYEPLIRKGLVLSALTAAELYRRQLGWKFDDQKFYAFTGEPEYVYPNSPPMAKEDLGKHR